MENNAKLDPHCEAMMQQYREMVPTLESLAKEAYDLLRRALREKGIYVTAIEYRVKTEKSLAGKLELKGAKYKSVAAFPGSWSSPGFVTRPTPFPPEI